jgi:hypothetical protein
MIRRSWIALAALLIASPAWADAFSSTPPAQQGKAGRDFIHAAPAMLSLADTTVPHDAQRAPAGYYAVSGTTKVVLFSTQSYAGMTVSCTSGSPNVTISPAVIATTMPTGVAQNEKMVLSACGYTSGAGAGIITAIGAPSGGSQTLTFSTNASITFSGSSTVQIATLTAEATNIRRWPNALAYVPITLAAGSATLTAPASTFNVDTDQTSPLFDPNSLLATNIAVEDVNGSCGIWYAMIQSVSADGSTATLVNRDGTTAAAPCAISNSARLWWGPALFATANATGTTVTSDVGKTFDIAMVGTSGAALTTVATAIPDPFTITTTDNIGTTNLTSAPMGQITWGTDATTAFNAVTASATTAGYGTLYVPPAYRLLIATPSFVNWSQVRQCGEGDIFYPQSATAFARFVPPCGFGAMLPPLESSILPNVHLKQTKLASTTIVLDCVGDSMAETGENKIGGMTSICDQVALKLQRDNPGKRVKYNNRGIGGTVWANIDPNGPNTGQGVGIPNVACASRPAWYVTCANKWITYVQADDPDVVVFRTGYNDNTNLLYSSILSSLNYFQTSAYKTGSAGSKNPDLILVTDALGAGTQAGNWTPKVTDMTTRVMAGISRGCRVTMALGGCVGLIDIGRARRLSLYGWDIDNLPLGYALYTAWGVPNSNPTITLPYTWPVNVYDYAMDVTLTAASTNTGAGSWTAFGTVCWGTGDGTLYTPQSAGGQVGAATTGYPGNRICALASGGTLHVFADAYNFTTSAVATATATQSTITCSAACLNMGHQGATVTMAGAGAAGGLYTGTVSAVSSNGQTLTVSPAIGTTVGTGTALNVFYRYIADTDTGVAPACTVSGANCNVLMVYHQQGNRAELRISNQDIGLAPDWIGYIEPMSGYFRPTLSITGSALVTRFRVSGGTSMSNSAEGLPDTGTIYPISRGEQSEWGPCDPVGGNPGYGGRFGGACLGHASSVGATTHEAAIDVLNLSVQ